VIKKRALLGLFGLAMVALLLVVAVFAASPSLKWLLIGSGGGLTQGAQNGLVSAIGQPLSGKVTNGYTIFNGLYFDSPAPGPAELYIFLPALMDRPCAGLASPKEIEPNDSPAQANGPLCPGKLYSGNPDSYGSGQDNDWYTINWSGSGSIAIKLDDFLADGQLLFYDDPEAQPLARDYLQPSGHYAINYTGNGQPGIYYIRVFAPAGHPTGNGDYTLSYQ
jgi:hypothetical protein